MNLKTVSAEKLQESYEALYPYERHSDNLQILANWLKRYENNPESCVSNSNWYGKVTKALFVALRITIPNNKKDMLSVLKGEF